MEKLNLPMSMMVLALSTICVGCIKTTLASHGNSQMAPVIDQVCVGTYWGYWITKSPQELMDEHAQHVAGGCVSTSGIFSVEMEQNIVDDLVSIGSLGLVVPISVKCWMQDDGKENVLPIEIEHNRKGMDE